MNPSISGPYLRSTTSKPATDTRPLIAMREPVRRDAPHTLPLIMYQYPRYSSLPSPASSITAARGGKKGFWSNPWARFGIPAVIAAIIIAAVVGGVVGSRNHNNSSNNLAASGSGSGSSSGSGSGNGSGGSGSGGKVSGQNLGVAASGGPTATDANGNPVYPTTTGSVAAAAPTVKAQSNLDCGADPFAPSNPSLTTIRPDHPRLFAPQYKWDCLAKRIAADPYMQMWNDTIFQNATVFYNAVPTVFVFDGGPSGSGALDIAREVQLRMKHWGYAYRTSKDTKWADRAWRELLHASGNTTDYFGTPGDNWNTQHFLDVGEFTLAFAYGYDWFFDAWNQTQKDAIMGSIIELGLKKGLLSYNDPTSHGQFGWWQSTNGNWNCVCNNGLTMGALAIAAEDTSGVAAQILALTVPNAAANCAFAVQNDGTWSETSDYWYFGTNAASEMLSGLMTATGGDQGLFSGNPNYNKTGLFHMYGSGPQGKFDYGDCGPNKYVATANGLALFGTYFNNPMYTLYQRDRAEAAEPLMMHWYDPSVQGNWWDGLPLDRYFDDANDTWASMRSSWTDPSAAYITLKGGRLTGHQTHGHLDIGDFVMDALGQRWVGELCQANYLGTDYFTSEAQTATRWLWYRTRTEGQNTIVVNKANQLVAGDSQGTFGTTGESQNSLAFQPPSSSSAFAVMDMTSNYAGVNSIKRGIRFFNGRKQILLQDEIDSTSTSEWRVHTNATITMADNNRTANLALNNQQLQAKIISPASGVTFTTAAPVRYASDPATPAGWPDMENPGVTVLVIEVPAGTTNLQVAFNPQWPGMAASAFSTPKNVGLSGWSATSHN